jgi:hypothetical protein
MKRFNFLRLTFSMLIIFSAGAQAKISIGLQLPLLKSAVVERDADGHELSHYGEQSLVMYRRSNSTKASSFVLTTRHPVEYIVTSDETDPNTGDVIYIAVNKKNLDSGSYNQAIPESFQRETLIVTDHAHNGEYHKYDWEARLVENSTRTEFARYFVGNSEPVNTVQKGCDPGRTN